MWWIVVILALVTIYATVIHYAKKVRTVPDPFLDAEQLKGPILEDTPPPVVLAEDPHPTAVKKATHHGARRKSKAK